MSEKVITSLFAVATLALIIINYKSVSSIITNSGTQYGNLVKGLQGR